MDFLAPRRSVLQSSRGVDLQSVLGNRLGPPLPSVCIELAGLLRAVCAKRAEIAVGLTQMLFGATDDCDDSSWYVNPMDLLFGPAPVCSTPHAMFTCYRALHQDVHFEVAGLEEPPSGPSGEKPPTGPQSLPEVGRSYGDAWLSALHLQAEPGTNEVQITLGIGSHAEFVPMVWGLLSGVISSLAVVAAGHSDAEDLCSAYRASFPHLAAHFAKLVDVRTMDISVEKVDAQTSRFTFDLPLDFAVMEQHYERLAELLHHFDRVSAKAVHPETGASLFELLLEEDVFHISLLVQDGELCWEGSSGPCEPVSWSSEGAFEYLLDIDCSIRLLGLSMAALPFPHLRLRFHLNRNLNGPGGSISVTCVEVGELLLESIASFVFDVALFRKLALERLRIEIVHRTAEKSGDGWVLAGFVRLPFPVAGVAQLFSSYFRNFMTRQMQEMHMLAVTQDFLTALSLDAAAMSRAAKRPSRRDVRQAYG